MLVKTDMMLVPAEIKKAKYRLWMLWCEVWVLFVFIVIKKGQSLLPHYSVECYPADADAVG